MTRRVLLLGASGQIGGQLLPLLEQAGDVVLPASRQPAHPGWGRIDLAHPSTGPSLECDLVISAGPLDLAVRWLQAGGARTPRVVAFGSTSVHSKRDAADPGERQLAARLAEAEEALLRWSRRHGCEATVLRPTLVYGTGAGRNLGRIVALGRRLGVVALPHRALGLRQPVHAGDLARTAMAAAALPRTPRFGYDLAGGETLPYRDMVRRVLDCAAPGVRLVQLPMPLMTAALAIAHAGGRVPDLRRAVLARMREDLVFDDAAGRAELGHAPRMFTPQAAMFVP